MVMECLELQGPSALKENAQLPRSTEWVLMACGTPVQSRSSSHFTKAVGAVWFCINLYWVTRWGLGHLIWGHVDLYEDDKDNDYTLFMNSLYSFADGVNALYMQWCLRAAIMRGPMRKAKLQECSMRTLNHSTKLISVAASLFWFIAGLAMWVVWVHHDHVPIQDWLLWQLCVTSSLWPRVGTSLLCQRDYEILQRDLEEMIVKAQTCSAKEVRCVYHQLRSSATDVAEFWRTFLTITTFLDCVLCFDMLAMAVFLYEHQKSGSNKAWSVVDELAYVCISLLQLISQLRPIAQFNETFDKASAVLLDAEAVYLQKSAGDDLTHADVPEGLATAISLLGSTSKLSLRLGGCVRITRRTLMSIVGSLMIMPIRGLIKDFCHRHLGKPD